MIALSAERSNEWVSEQGIEQMSESVSESHCSGQRPTNRESVRIYLQHAMFMLALLTQKTHSKPVRRSRRSVAAARQRQRRRLLSQPPLALNKTHSNGVVTSAAGRKSFLFGFAVRAVTRRRSLANILISISIHFVFKRATQRNANAWQKPELAAH